MPVNYEEGSGSVCNFKLTRYHEEVLRDLEDQENRLLTELNTVRTAKPAIILLSKSQQAKEAKVLPLGGYAGLGPKAALRNIFFFNGRTS